MISLPPEEEMINAFMQRDSRYEGIFFVGVKTTGIFCRPTCSARKPNKENITFFKSTKQALDEGYRPCKRCKPMQVKGDLPDWIMTILNAVDKEPLRHWKDSELQELGIYPNRLRRWFKKNHGMTFQTYLRLRRLGNALGRIKHGDDLTDVAFDNGYDSLSGFRDAVKQITGLTPVKSRESTIVYVNRITTPLGPMLAGTTNNGLCLLEFIDRRMLETQLKRIRKHLNATIIPGSNDYTEMVSRQIGEYFNGKRKEFSIPLQTPGTEFQQKVWNQLKRIPYGSTRSYEKQAIAINRPKAVRAVARANGDNRIAIIIPCHRVIAKDGNLCGYGGGIWRKKYLLDLEHKFKNM
jgi:AraC family transcriptional regulator of adaptative response/methylated-DNA-[protein]-cysteine methyltransferase